MHFCSKGLAARQIENLLLEERDAIALPQEDAVPDWHFIPRP
jgi:hypothetical protein